MNVVVIVADTLRADHLGCYGYARPTSPAMDTLAAQSIVFDHAFAPHIPTQPSFTTLYTGMHALAHRIVCHWGEKALDRRIQLLPQLLNAAGYATAAVDNLVVLSLGRGSWFARGYDFYSGFVFRPGTGQTAQITARALEVLDLVRAEPFFLLVHYWEPHAPYLPPRPFDGMFYQGDPRDPRHDSMRPIYAVAGDYYRAAMADMNMSDVTDAAYAVAQYDAAIRAQDAAVEQLVSALQERDLWDDTIVLLLADHGEAFGEGGLYFDHHGLYDAVVRAAMIMRVPGRPGARIDALAGLDDVAPTLLDLLDLPIPAQMTGRSLRPLLDGETMAPREALFLTEASRQATYGVRTREWKLLVPVVTNLYGRPIPDPYGRLRDPSPLLFNLAADPAEVYNVYEEHADTARELEELLRTWKRSQLERYGRPDPVAAQAPSLGYDRTMRRLYDRLGWGSWPPAPAQG